MAYQEFGPPSDLADLVVCTWERTVPPSGGAGAHRVLPDGCVDLVWGGGALKLAGPDTGAFMSPLEPGATIVGLRLRPGVAGAVLGLPARELRDVRVDLDEVWGRRGAEIAERAGRVNDPVRQRRILEDSIRARRSRGDVLDSAVLAAVRALGSPGARVRVVSDRLGLSDRQLLRRFQVAVGYGPKTLDRVLRFQRFLARAGRPGVAGDALAGIAFELGYADQAHLTRECVELSGLTPAVLVSNGERDPDG